MDTRTKINQHGFTLPELMLAVAVMSTLSAVAVPVYQDYRIKAQATEALVLAGAAKTAVTTHFETNGKMPTNNVDAGLAATEVLGHDAKTSVGRYVDSVNVENGAIVAHLGNQADTKLKDKVITLIPEGGAGGVQWQCEATVGDAHLPSGCKGVSNIVTECTNSGEIPITTESEIERYKNGASPPTLVYPEAFESIMPGETVEFRWTGGAGSLANIHFSTYDPDTDRWEYVFVEGPVPNDGSHQLTIPDSVPKGMYSVQLQNFETDKICLWADYIGYYDAPSPKVLVTDTIWSKVGWGPTEETAISNCNNPTEPSWVWSPYPCGEVVDINNNYCTSGVGGESESHSFFIGPVIKKLIPTSTAQNQTSGVGNCRG